MSNDVQEQGTLQSKKRDASSPLQNPEESIKKHKQYRTSDNSLCDIEESISDFSDSSETETKSSEAIAKSETVKMAANRISDENIDRIALRVQAIMMPSMKE